MLASLLTLLPGVGGTTAAGAVPAPVAPPGPGPVDRPLPETAEENHGLPPGERPPVVPPGVPAETPPLTTSDEPPPPDPLPPRGDTGARDLLLRPGFALDDTSLILYFDAADPGVEGWASWRAVVRDVETGAVQESAVLEPAEATRCGVPRRHCRSFGTADGWTLVDGHGYAVTIVVELLDGTEVSSEESGPAGARTTVTPPPVPDEQAGGCTCGTSAVAANESQAVRGLGVNTGTGAFTLSAVDLQMDGFGIPFRTARHYSSANGDAGRLGRGWSWTFDIRVTPPTGGGTSVKVHAENGAQVVYERAEDGTYRRPPGVRSTLEAVDGGWRLVTPDQVRFTFDADGRLQTVLDGRGHGLTLAYAADRLTITEAGGRVVTAYLGRDGLVERIVLPDRRAVRYGYTDGLLTRVTDATGATWTYKYHDGLLTEAVDPRRRVQVRNQYAGGRVIRQTDAADAVTTFVWDADEEVATTIDADGVEFLDGYRGNVLLHSQNGNGDTVVRRYDPGINPTLVVDAQGGQTTSSFDAAGNLTSATAPDPASTTVANAYDARNNLVAHTDGRGHTTTYAYDTGDELTAVTDPAGGHTELRTDERGLVTARVDPLGHVTTMEYDGVGNLVAETTPLGETTRFAYDATSRLVARTDPRGTGPGGDPEAYTTRYRYDELDRVRETRAPGKRHPATRTYDEVGQLVATTDPLGNRTTQDFAKVIDRVTATEDANGHATTYTYTPAGRRASMTDAEGGRTTYSYDNRGNLATVVSPRGNAAGANPADFTTRYVYDVNNNLLRATRPYPGGGFTSTDTRYDELNRPVATIDPIGKTTRTTYDGDGNVVSTVDPLGRATTMTYDVNDRVTAIEGPGADRESTGYDAAGNVIRQVSPVGGVTTSTYNPNGDLASTVDPRGNAPGADPAQYTTTYAYDAARNLVEVTDPLGHAVGTEYDANNRRVSSADGNGHVVRYRYDDADRLTSVGVPGPARDTRTGSGGWHDPATTYAYDGVGRVVARTDPNGHTSRYRYDAVGRLASVADPLGRTTSHRYDAGGNRTHTVLPGHGDAARRTIATSYDLLDRRVGQDLGGGRAIFAWGYDARNLVTSLADGAGLRLQTYDDIGRLTEVTRGRATFSYGYDAQGNVTSREWPDGTTVDATFDDGARMTGLTVQGGVAGDPSTYSFSYDVSGRLTRTDAPAATGLVTDRTYDRAGRLVDLHSRDGAGVVARYQLTRDAVGNPTAVTTTRGDRTQAVGYAYDASDRVTATCVGAPGCPDGTTPTAAYRYDDVGNRRSQTTATPEGEVRTEYRYDVADQLLSETASGPGWDRRTRHYAYDDAGNQIAAGDDRFTYNLDQTLASATVGGRTTSYTYDAQGLQLSAVTGGADTTTSRSRANDVNGRLTHPSLETTETGGEPSIQGFLVDAQGTALGLLQDGRLRPVAPDWLGGVADLVGPTGGSEASYDYDPFGAPRTDGTAGGPGEVDNPLRFASAYQDRTLGDRYGFPARVYDPATGRFGGVDPVAPAQSAPTVSSYAYAENRPTVLVDPLGTVTCTRLDDPSGPCVTNAEAIRNYTGVPAPDPAAPPSDPGGVPGLTVAPVKPPVIAPRPPAPIPPGVRAAGRLGGIAGVLACVLFCLSGDSAPDDEQLRIDTDERKKHCLDNDSPPTAPTYFELQDGRATGVEACLGPWSTTVDHRPPPTPLGFLPGMNRSHLLARTLGGHSILENIVPMWEYANKSGMATMENRFRRLINQEGRVYVFTAPIYPKTSHPEWKELGEAPWAVSYTYATRSSVQGPQVVLNDP